MMWGTYFYGREQTKERDRQLQQKLNQDDLSSEADSRTSTSRTSQTIGWTCLSALVFLLAIIALQLTF